MELTRAALAGKLGTLEQQVLDTVTNVTSAVTESAKTVKDAVDDTMNNVKDTLNLPLQMRRHPWVIVGGAVALGYLGGCLLFRNGAAPPAGNGFAQAPPPDKPPIPETRIGNGADSRPVNTAAAQLNSKPAHGATEPGWLTGVNSQFAPEIAKLKGYAITALLGALRDMVTQSAPPPMKAALADVIDGIAVKLGAEPIRAAAPSDASIAGTEQQNGPNGSGAARPVGVRQQ
jgi:hypothetical protein